MIRKIKKWSPFLNETRNYKPGRQYISRSWQNLARIITLIIGLLPILQLQAQPTIYPITVRPLMIAGGSVYLGDFANPMATANRLRFILTLQDPVEQERTVYFRLTIVQNGTIIASNPPGFRGNMVTLQRNVPYQINGEDLARNLNINNLYGLNGPSAYGVLNEGTTDFCLEVIDAFRGEPVSLRQCATGYLTRLQPPLLILPMEKQNITVGRLNNMVFTWNMQDPLAHLPFSEISYLFELRKKTPFLNAQDKFENQALIFSSVVDRFSLFYNEMIPQLEPGNTYIWRVTAQFRNQAGILQPNYFVHNGISRVGTFQVLPEIETNYTTRTTCDCEPGDCIPTIKDFMPSSKQLSIGDSVRYGAFYMRINSLSGNYGSGQGSVNIPFLNTSVLVDFKNLAINDKYEVSSGKLTLLTSGLIKNIGQDRDKLPDLSKISVNSDWLQGINQHVNEKRSSMVLPVSLGNILAAQDFKMPFEIFITDLQFKYNNVATASLLLSIANANGQILNFGATGVRIGRHGFDMDGLKLYLINDEISLTGIGSENIVVRRVVNDDPSKGTFISFNCVGLEEFNLQAEYTFPLEQLQRSEHPEEAVVAQLTLNGSEWGRFTGVGHLPQFSISGAPEWKFNAREILVDLDPLSNPSGILFPPGYNVSGTEWRGFYLKKVTIEMPKDINLATGKLISFVTPGVLLDANGTNCRCGGSDVLNLSTGKVGGWAYSIDTINLNIIQNDFVDAHVGGQMGIGPLDTELSYQGLILKSKEDDYFFNLSPVGEFRIPFLLMDAEIEDGSYLAIEKPEGGDSYHPYTDLNLKVDIHAAEKYLINAGLDSAIYKVKDVFSITEFDFGVSDLHFKSFKINHPDLPPGKYFGLDDADGGTVSISGLDGIGLSGLTLLEQNTDFGKENLPGLGLEMRVNIGLVSLGVGIWGKENGQKIGRGYSFGKFELSFPEFSKVSFQCNCEGSESGSRQSDYCKDPVLVGGENIDIRVGEIIQVGHFAMQVMEVNGNQGVGQVGIPFLNSKMAVSFEDAVVRKMLDGSKRLVSGTVMTSLSTGMGDYNVEVEDEAGPIDLSDLGDIPTFLDEIADISSRGDDFFTLPISLSKSMKTLTGVALPEGLDFIILGIKFGPTNARFSAMVTLKLPDDNYMKFGLTGANIRPDGFNMDGVKIYLADNFTMKVK